MEKILYPELTSYITQKLAAGEDGSIILQDLLNAGWKREVILKTYMNVITAVQAKPPITGSLLTRLRIKFLRLSIKRKRIITLSVFMVIEIAIILTYILYYKNN